MLVYDRTSDEYLFEGNFRDYQREVCRYHMEGIASVDDAEKILEILYNAKNFEDLFEMLNFEKLNIFGELSECVLVRRKCDFVINKFGRKRNY